MPAKKPRDPKARKDKMDVSERGMRAVLIAAGEIPNPDKQSDPQAAAAGRKGGVRGGKRRMAAMTKAERAALGKKAARSRWRPKK